MTTTYACLIGSWQCHPSRSAEVRKSAGGGPALLEQGGVLILRYYYTINAGMVCAGGS